MKGNEAVLPARKRKGPEAMRFYARATGPAVLLLLGILLFAVAGCNGLEKPEADLVEPPGAEQDENDGKDLIPMEQVITDKHESVPLLDRSVPGNLKTATFAMG